MYFDPSVPQAARWRHWLTTGLADRGVPSNATLEMQIQPVYEAPVTRLYVNVRWSAQDGQRRTRSEVLIPNRRLIGDGWSGWPAYLAAIKLLRSLG